MRNLVRIFNISKSYVDKDDPWTGILDAAEFVILKTTNRLKVYSPEKLLFGHEMIIPIKHKVDWELIYQQKQTQINKENISETKNIIYHDYNAVDKVILGNHDAYKYETPYEGPFLIIQC